MKANFRVYFITLLQAMNERYKIQGQRKQTAVNERTIGGQEAQRCEGERRERERLTSQTDQEMARSWLSAGPLLRVVMEWVGWETDFGVVSSLMVVEFALGRPGLLFSVLRRGSAGS